MGFKDSKIIANYFPITAEDINKADEKIKNWPQYPNGICDIAKIEPKLMLGYVAEAVMARSIFGGHEHMIMDVNSSTDINYNGTGYDVKLRDKNNELLARELKEGIDYFIFCTTSFKVSTNQILNNKYIMVDKDMVYKGYLPFNEAKIGKNEIIQEKVPTAKEVSSRFKSIFKNLLGQDAVLANELHMSLSELEFKERLAVDTIGLKEKYGESNIEKTDDYVKIRINIYLDDRFSTENNIIQKMGREVRDKLDSDIEEATGRKINEFEVFVESSGNIIFFTYQLK